MSLSCFYLINLYIRNAKNLTCTYDNFPHCIEKIRYTLQHINLMPSFILLSYAIASGSEITPCNKIEKTNSGLQFYGKRYDVYNNAVYIMTKL